MINPTGKKLQDIISKMIDNEIEGIDKYTLNGSTWLIFTDQKRWVIEYTEDGILWYNYSFFTDIFAFLSLKATDNQHIIQEWFESKFLKPKVNDTRHYKRAGVGRVEETIQNGVKDTSFVNPYFNQNVEETIQNGVKRTLKCLERKSLVEDTIQNGVNHTERGGMLKAITVEETIQNKVKDTRSSANFVGPRVEETIQHGVKETSYHGFEQQNIVEDTIQNGVKRTLKCLHRKSLVEDTIQNGVKQTLADEFDSLIVVDDTIQNGVKHTHKRLQQFPDNALEAIQKGVKKTMHLDMDDDYVLVVEEAIQKGVKHTQFGGSAQVKSVEDTIQKGVKETKPCTSASWTEVDNTIQNGVKEMKEVSELSLVSEIFKVNCKKAIQNGVKQTNPMDEWVNSHNIISDVMDYGNIEMVGTGHATDNEMNDVIENGVKEIGHKKTPDESFTNHIIEDGVKEVRTDDGYVNHFRQNYKFNNVFEDIVKEVQSDCSNNTERVNGVIRIGKKLN